MTGHVDKDPALEELKAIRKDVRTIAIIVALQFSIGILAALVYLLQS